MRSMKLWTPPEEARLLLAATLCRAGVVSRFARAAGRTERSVRIKLCRLEKDPANRAPQPFARQRACGDGAAPTDAAAPRVQPARGPDSTPDREA